MRCGSKERERGFVLRRAREMSRVRVGERGRMERDVEDIVETCGRVVWFVWCSFVGSDRVGS